MKARRPHSDPTKLAALVRYATPITSCDDNREVMRLGSDCVRFIEHNSPIALPKTGPIRTIVCAARDRLETAHRETPSTLDRAILACLIGRLYDLDYELHEALRWYLKAEEHLEGMNSQDDGGLYGWQHYCISRIAANPVGRRMIARGDLAL